MILALVINEHVLAEKEKVELYSEPLDSMEFAIHK